MAGGSLPQNILMAPNLPTILFRENLMWLDYLKGPLLFRQGSGIPVAIILIAIIILPLFRRNAFTVVLAIMGILAWLFFGLILHGVDA